MANEMPPSRDFTGLTAKVIEYSEQFTRLTDTAKQRTLTDADWAGIEALVDVDNFERHGVFLDPVAERFGWATYRDYVTRYAAHTEWEGTMRHITEEPGRVILELEERNTTGGKTHVSNTVTVYEFGDDGQLRHLDVYVMPLG